MKFHNCNHTTFHPFISMQNKLPFNKWFFFEVLTRDRIIIFTMVLPLFKTFSIFHFKTCWADVCNKLSNPQFVLHLSELKKKTEKEILILSICKPRKQLLIVSSSNKHRSAHARGIVFNNAI